MTTIDQNTDQADQPKPTRTKAERNALIAAGVLLGLVIIAPIVLSTTDLITWAESAPGLGMKPQTSWLVPVGLDLAAAACIVMSLIATWRKERPGIFGILVWVFAGVSAFAQYKHGMTERQAGRAQDLVWAMPAFALLGPFLLEATLNRLRRWYRQDSGTHHTGAAGFGPRWIPGVAFWETLRAWAASRREGIESWKEAVAYVRERKALEGLSPADALRYAIEARGSWDMYGARRWLQARYVMIDQATVDQVLATRPTGPAMPALPVPISPAGVVGTGMSDRDFHRLQLEACTTKRQAIRYAYTVIGELDPPHARRWLADMGVDVQATECHAVKRELSGALSGNTGGFPAITAQAQPGHDG